LWDEEEMQEELQGALGPAYVSYIASALETLVVEDKKS
jgi:hypothetical protein